MEEWFPLVGWRPSDAVRLERQELKIVFRD